MEELREKIADILPRLCDWCTRISCEFGLGNICKEQYKYADQILALLKEAGYRKIEGKPPVLSAEEKDKICKIICDIKGCSCDVGCQDEIAQAQRDIDVSFYNAIQARQSNGIIW